MNRPNFLIIGAPKAGTTSLYEYVNQHPDVHMSTPKETRFFDSWRYENGVAHYWESYFGGWKGQKAVGDATPTYLGTPFVPRRIKESLPDAKLITVLRNPVERSYSHWLMQYTYGRDKCSFEDSIRENFERIQSMSHHGGARNEYEWYGHNDPGSCRKVYSKYRHYLEHSLYHENIQRYLSLFDMSQLRCVFYSDFCSDPQAVVKDIWGFLGVHTDVDLVEIIPRNVSFSSKNVKMAFNPLFKTNLNTLFPKSVRLRLRNLFSKIGKKPQMSAEAKAWLIEYFYPYNRKLETLMGCGLSHWDK